MTPNYNRIRALAQTVVQEGHRLRAAAHLRDTHANSSEMQGGDLSARKTAQIKADAAESDRAACAHRLLSAHTALACERGAERAAMAADVIAAKPNSYAPEAR